MRNARNRMRQGGIWLCGVWQDMKRAGRLGLAGIALCLLCGPGTPVLAQDDQFAPAITVNGEVITRYEIDQRRNFLKALNQPGDQQQLAENGLITDRLQSGVARQAGITVSDAEVAAGTAEFAARGKLSTEDFLKLLGQNGVEPETFRDFVQSGLLWREVLRAKFAGRIQISETEIDLALAAGAASGGKVQVLLSEIVLPEDGKNDRNLIVQRIKQKTKSPADFAFQAKLYSKVDTAANGGELGWIDEDALPPAVAQAVGRLKPGEMTDVIPQQGALTLYFLRDISQTAGEPKGAPVVDYALLQPGAGLDLVRVQQTVTTCDGLYVVARGLPPAALLRQTVPESSLPAPLRGTVAGLDAGESALVTASNGTPALVMLCSRIPQSKVPPSRDNVREALINQKVGLLAQAFLEELRSNALIVRQ